MTEDVRLVIWDLDETFWDGTLTEGGIRAYRQDNHDLVVALASRGIMSSICSKNDFDRIREVLSQDNIWEFFIFPSVNWEAKGPRISQLIAQVQLRPENVMFIDDNPLNRAEAAAASPGIQIADERFVGRILADPRFRGKDDLALNRLHQYKALENKQREAAEVGGTNEEFLRTCDIRVRVELDIERHIDRATELVNRTNQLNFTKVRLPEDIELARRDLRGLLASRNIQAGLVSVSDKYGDYGFVGFYVINVHSRQLYHYCWSCRILGMMVEVWFFARLDRPRIAIAGEVVSDLRCARLPIDWIKFAESKTERADSCKQSVRIFVRGGCDLQSVAHFLALDSRYSTLEFPTSRAGMSIRIDHSIFLHYAIKGIEEDQLSAARRLGYEREDFSSTIATQVFDIYVFSFWHELAGLYRHNETNVKVPFTLSLFDNARDVTGEAARLADETCSADERGRLRNLREAFIFEQASLSDCAERIRMIFASIPSDKLKIVLLACESSPLGDQTFRHFKAINESIRAAVNRVPNVLLLSVSEFLQEPNEFIDATHFSRLVYHRIYERVSSEIGRFGLANLNGEADSGANLTA